MIDLRTKLQTAQYLYNVSHLDTCTMVSPKENYVNKEPFVQELSTSTFLKADRYSLGWRISCSNTSQLFKCCMMVFINNFNYPSLSYDLKQYPEYNIAFRLEKSQYVYVLIQIQARTTINIHTLHFMLARDIVVGRDPLMYEWDMSKVASALKQQRRIRHKLIKMHTLFDWETLKDMMREWLNMWAHVFGQENRKKCHEYQQNTIQCIKHVPDFFGTTDSAMMGNIIFEQEGLCSLELHGQMVSPTYTHMQYFIWCFPDRSIKIALRRDTQLYNKKQPFSIERNNPQHTPIWYWLGYNFIGNSPYFNIWCIDVDTLEFINREDILSMFEQIEEHFDMQELHPEMNLYK